MGFEAIAVFPAIFSGVLLCILFISDLCDIRQKFKATLFAVILTLCTTAVLFPVVFLLLQFPDSGFLPGSLPGLVFLGFQTFKMPPMVKIAFSV